MLGNGSVTIGGSGGGGNGGVAGSSGGGAGTNGLGGGGGGGGQNCSSGAGGSGIVIVRYALTDIISTVTTNYLKHYRRTRICGSITGV